MHFRSNLAYLSMPLRPQRPEEIPVLITRLKPVVISYSLLGREMPFGEDHISVDLTVSSYPNPLAMLVGA